MIPLCPSASNPVVLAGFFLLERTRKMPESKLIKTNVFVFNRHNNGGEQFSLTTKFFANGDPGGIFPIHQFALQSYTNFATITLGDDITPSDLRNLANELDKSRQEAELIVAGDNQ